MAFVTHRLGSDWLCLVVYQRLHDQPVLLVRPRLGWLSWLQIDGHPSSSLAATVNDQGRLEVHDLEHRHPGSAYWQTAAAAADQLTQAC